MSATPEFRRKYGVYLPHQRFNVDQVPLPFVNGLNETYEEIGSKRVAINQNGHSLSKRQATGRDKVAHMFLTEGWESWQRFLS